MHRVDPALHARLCAAAARDPVESFRAAIHLAPDLLPLYLDWVGLFGLSADGTIFFIPWDPPHHRELVPEPHWIRVALVAGAEHYPELAFLRPERPPEAVTCKFCGGLGHPSIGGRPIPDNIRCFCGGLGWLLPGEAEQVSPA